ncbi:hypothetical protein Alvin_2580 [Allochromatium vinosum DSM 180]|uniref:Uncharacterized protein n=2 Tax=Allochromatium vinosum TaxID=1049 RepID=D3RPA0_ALLVD|nr:hypothetical protein Alvin_2580 [Allochromatium vinosum DSM 180]
MHKSPFVDPNLREELHVKFAAKRTWPDKATTWEHQGEADDVESFASEFATLEQLAVGAEFVVMCKDEDEQGVRFFRVAATAPCRLEPAEARTASTADAGSEPAAGEDESEPVGLPNLSPVISMIFYMGKVAFIATAGIALMALIITYLRKFLE